MNKGSNVQLHLIADTRGFNLLLLAAENGQNDVVKILLDQKLETEFYQKGNRITAQNLAWSANHHEIVLTLVKAGATYPNLFQINECQSDLREFCEKSEELHSAIIAGDAEKIVKILEKVSKSHPFYNRVNESAAKFALKSKQIQIYQQLVSHKIFLGRHEILHDSWKDFSEDDREALRKIHLKYSINVPEKHINDLTNCSSVSHDDADATANLNLVKYAFKILNENPFIQIILKIVAASKKLKILFDFKSGFVDVVDPTAGSDHKGMFYTKGLIYVGGWYLLGQSTEHETFGTLAHELCHYAMKLVYGNLAKPYKQNDMESRRKYEKVFKKCQENRAKEPIINLVFTYPAREQHAELIVRVPHLMALYHNNPEKIQKARENFSELFDYFEHKVVPDMNQALPKIEKKIEKMDQRILINKIILIATIILSVILLISGFFVVRSIFISPVYKFSELPLAEQTNIETAPIIYKNVNLQFRDLFSQNSTAYDQLISDHISQMLRRQTLNLSGQHFEYLNDLILHKWDNMTDKLKQKILNSDLIFQNESINLKELNKICPESFSFLTSDQIIKILNNNASEIDKMISNQTQFYVDRIFWDENIFETFYEISQSSQAPEMNEKIFRKSYENFTTQNVDLYLEKISNVKESLEFRRSFNEDYLNSFGDLEKFKSFRIDFDKIQKMAKESRIFILSSEAGTGKTTSYEQFTIKIKKAAPLTWVSYIDLKEWTKFYNKCDSLEDVLNILENILNSESKSEFEKKIFHELFKNGLVTLLWNGFDEISPKYSEFILNVMNLIHQNTANIQYVCTRPLYSNLLRSKFNILTYTFVTFDKIRQEEFLTKSFKVKNIDKTEVSDYVEKVYQILIKLKAKVLNQNPPEDLNTPFILEMIADIISTQDKDFNTENIYEIYQTFILKKISIWQDKSVIAKKLLPEIIVKGDFNVMRMYQKYALKSELPKIEDLIYFNSKKFKIFHEPIHEYLTNEEISRMGILYINDRDYRFAHKTFAEFFVAQFFIDHIYLGKNIEKDTEFIVKSFFDVTRKYEFSQTMITHFISSYLQTNSSLISVKFDEKVEHIIRTKFLRIFFDLLKRNNIKIYSFLFKFFAKDSKLLSDMLKIDENETLYTASFNIAYFPLDENIPDFFLDRNNLKNLGRKYLTEWESQKFINGRYQKGIIMFSLYLFNKQFSRKQKKSTVEHPDYKISRKILNEKNFYKVFEFIEKNLNKDEFKELLLSTSSPVTYVVHKYKNQMLAFIQHENVWKIIETNLTSQEQKVFISNLFLGISKSDVDKDIDEFLIPKVTEKFNKTEIVEIFYDQNILQEAASRNWANFLTFWMFFENLANKFERKKMLKHEIFGKCFNSYLNLPHEDCNELPLMNIFTFALNLNEFQHIAGIYETYFSTTEIQQLILKSNQFLPFLIMSYNEISCESFTNFLRKLFINNETLLHNYLKQRVEPFNLTIFDVMNDIGHNRIEIVAKMIKMFSKLLSFQTSTQISKFN